MITDVAPLASLLARAQTEGKLPDLLLALLTPKELAEIANRIAILKALREGRPQREVAQELGVGIATVSRGASALRTGNLQALEDLL